MNKTREFIMELHARGVRLVVDNGQLKSRSAAGAIDAAMGASIRARKDELIGFLTQRQPGEGEDGTIPRAPYGASRPLSFAQQRLWFIDQLEGSAQYVIPLALDVRGALDIGAARAAMSAIVRKHEALRTVIRDDGTEPEQVLLAEANVPMDQHDLRSLGQDEREREVARLVRWNRERPFDLRRDLMVRACLVWLEDGVWIVLAAMHHIASDGWSINLFLREFSDAYAMAHAGAAVVLAPLSIQYADYAAWQRRRTDEGRLAGHLAYWREALADLPQVHGIPLDHPRPPRKGNVASRLTWRFDRSTTNALRELGRAGDATLFMVLHAALVVVLARWSRSDDVVVGTPVSGRTHESLAPLIGYFANTLALRARLRPGMTFRELLASCRECCLAAYEHQEVPFERVAEVVRAERSPSFTPVFQILFSMPNVDHRQLECAGLEIAVRPSATVNSMFDLDIAIVEDADGLALRWDADSDMFDPTSVARMLTAYRRVLEAVLADVDTPVEAIDLIDTADVGLMSKLNDTGKAYPSEVAVHRLIEDQVALTPLRTAVISAGECWTYAEFNGMANALAGSLIADGVGPGELVPVVMAPGVEVPLAFLAIMKAGAAFAPIDIAWPEERRRLAIAALGAKRVLISDSRTDTGGVPPCLVMADRRRSAANPDRPHDSEATIYAVHTSGSTGTPKAALNLHRGIVNRLVFMSRHFNAAADEVVLQTTHHCFDSAVWQFFWPLIKGGATVVPRFDGPFDIADVARLVVGHEVTFTDFTPALLGLYLEYLAADGGAASGIRLRDIVVGGEETTPTLARRCADVLPQVRLHNFYGPSEASIGAICHTLSADFRGAVPIGRPIDNVVVSLVGADLRPVPFGAPGELLLGGEGVGTGYVGLPEITAHAFVTLDPPRFGRRAFYRTGDLARYRSDGEIEFLGRIDAQVKIRGFRIEPGEVQSALEALASVRQAHVRVKGEGSNRRLVAYIVPVDPVRADDAGFAATLREALAGLLPDYMIPSAHMVLTSLPMTPGGKIDVRALPEPELTVARRHREPSTGEERVLASIWSDLFAVEVVGVDDDFFERGGHSLLAMRVAARLRQEWSIDVPLRVVFERSRLSDLARWCADARRPANAEA